ncbi:MAG: CBS domain-containing protein [Gammaproteobacteria bacterium]
MTEKSIVKVRDVMKTKFDVVDGMTTIKDALDKMEHIETKCLIVNKRHPDDEYGLLLISDIARKVLANNRSVERINVYEIMAKPVLTVAPDMNIRYCARLFQQFDLSRAPVIEEDKIIGIISFTDMVLKGLNKIKE